MQLKKKIGVGILGATGAVGQRFLSLLEEHPWFTVVCLGASDIRSGKLYGETVSWRLSKPLPKTFANIILTECNPKYFKEKCLLVFSALDSNVAERIEKDFADAGIPVFSNAKSYRYHEHVPILIPFINSNHVEAINKQESYQQSGGFIVTNANCTSTGLAIALSPLLEYYGNIESIQVSSMQAISGAGYPGLPSLDILANVVPYIKEEEEKVEYEPRKIHGTCIKSDETSFLLHNMKISAMCHRVPVVEGHTVSMSIKFKNFNKDENYIPKLEKIFKEYTTPLNVAKLPSCPKSIFCVKTEIDRPQPRLDCTEENGMITFIGKLRSCPINDLKLTIAFHNTILGAAGMSILNAEFCVSEGFIKLK